jgi:hypothetical protein
MIRSEKMRKNDHNSGSRNGCIGSGFCPLFYHITIIELAGEPEHAANAFELG